MQIMKQKTNLKAKLVFFNVRPNALFDLIQAIKYSDMIDFSCCIPINGLHVRCHALDFLR